MTKAMGFEEVEHTADWALRISGRDLSELFVNAAYGLNQLLAPCEETAAQVLKTEMTFEAPDVESLLVDWLTELVYRAEVDQVIYRSVLVDKATPSFLHVLAQGNQVADLRNHVKAVTYHDLRVRVTEHGYEVTVVFDV
jgi:SHS2 domain-containing protein